MKKLITTALATMVAVYGYSQTYLPTTGGTLTGTLAGTSASFTSTVTSDAWLQSDKGLIHKNPVSNDNTFGLYFANDAQTQYAITRSPGAWTSPYPDLRIAFHTGIRIGAHFSYGGTRFYNNSDMATEIMSIGNGDNNVRVGYGLNVNGALIGTSATFNGVTAQTNNFTSNVTGGGFYHSGVNAGMYGDSGYLRITNWDSQMKGINIQVSTGNVAIGANNPGSYKLFINGPSSAQLDADGDNMADFVNTHNGTYTYGAGGVIIRTANTVSSANYAAGSGALVIRNGGTNYSANINYNGSAYFAGPFLLGSTTDDGVNKLQVAGSGIFGGNVSIGNTQANSNLYVYGTVKSKEVKVEANVSVPDYVFEKSYDLKSLAEVEKYVIDNKHLPEIPSAKEIEKEGINVGQMQMKLLQKIEELTLHLIEQNKRIENQEREMDAVKHRNQELEKKVFSLEAKR